MLYYSEFRDFNNKAYRVEIVTDNRRTPTKEFTLGGEPFSTTMDSDGKHIYAPIKSTGATVRIVTREFLFDLYTGKAQGNSVKLLSGDNWNTVEWTGYVTPCMYDMGFQELEEIEVECVDGISVLKQLPYKSVNADKQTLEFDKILRRILKAAGCYKNFYISDNVQMTANGTESVIDKFRIDEQNFFDEKDDLSQPDDEVAMSCYDVLYEICQFLGYSLTTYHDDVYIVDYDAIKRGVNTYYKYSLENDSKPTRVTLSDNYAIADNSHADNGAKVSLDDVYNKVTVKDEYYTFEDVIPELGDEKFETNVTRIVMDSTDHFPYFNKNNSHYKRTYPYDYFERYSRTGRDTSFMIFICNGWKGKTWVCIVQFYSTPFLTQGRWNSTLQDRTAELANKRLSWGDVLNYKGAFYCKFWHKEIGNFNSWRANYVLNWHSMSESERYMAWKKLLDDTDPQSITLSPYIIMTNDSANHIQPANAVNYPYIKFSSPNTGTTFGGEGAFLVIQGSVCYHDEQNTPFPMSDGANNGDLERDVDCKRGEEMYVPCYLRWGDQWYNGEGWSSDKREFPLRFGIPNQGRHYNRDHYANKHIYDKFVEFIDTAQSQYNCTEKGVYIPCPPNGNLEGGIELTVGAPKDMYGDSYHGHWDGYGRYRSYVWILKGLKLVAHIDNGLLDDKENDSDTIFTNLVSAGAVDEMDEITFKVCTYDNKKPNYSSVSYLDGTTSKWLTTTYNKALNALENGTDSTFEESGLIQEEHLIFKLVSQYEEPRKVFAPILHYNDFKSYTLFTDKTLDGKYIANTIAISYRECTAEVELIEKA